MDIAPRIGTKILSPLLPNRLYSTLVASTDLNRAFDEAISLGSKWLAKGSSSIETVAMAQ